MPGLLLLQDGQLRELLQAHSRPGERVLRHGGQFGSTCRTRGRPVRQRLHGLVELRVRHLAGAGRELRGRRLPQSLDAVGLCQQRLQAGLGHLVNGRRVGVQLSLDIR